MAELQDPKREESVFGTTDAPCNHACIGHGAGGLVSHPEFVDACLALVDRYHDKSRIGNFTFEWKGESGCHYLSISGYLSPASKAIRGGKFAKPPTHDLEDTDRLLSIEDDEALDEAAIHHSASEHQPCVEYHVLYSPSYQVPVLYFHLHQLPPTASQGLDAIYEWLVPRKIENGLRNHGIIGGISMANHPVTDLPAFFIHPCNTAEAMKQIVDGRFILPLEYLQMWFGLVGSTVGLYLPKDIVMDS